MNIHDKTVHQISIAGVVHLARTLIAGCTTECGHSLREGWPTHRGPVARLSSLCPRCVDAIENLPYYGRGVRA